MNLVQGLGTLRWLSLALALGSLLACQSGGPAYSARDAVRDGAPPGEVDVNALVDAVPRHEPVTRAGNKNPYTVLGKTYTLLPSARGYVEVGEASWYGSKFHGRNTANGEVFDMYAMSAAHKTLPIPAYVRVTNLDNGRSAVIRVNDRGPFHGGRIIDLSYAAAKKLGYADRGVAQVRVQTVEPQVPLALPPLSTEPAPLPVALTSASAPSAGREAARSQRFLQVGAFESLAAARAVQDLIAGAITLPISIRPPGGDGAGLYKIWVGPLGDERQMLSVRQQLTAIDGLQPFAVRGP